MAKIQIKSEEAHSFGGIFSIMEQFDSTLSSVIDSTLGLIYYTAQNTSVVAQLFTHLILIYPIKELTRNISYTYG